LFSTSRVFRLLAAALFPAFVTLTVKTEPARAEVSVEGDAAAALIIARDALLSEVLFTLKTTFGVHYDSFISLQVPVTGTYSGPIDELLPRMLVGFDYVLTRREGSIELLIVSRSNEAPLPARQVPSQFALPTGGDLVAPSRSTTGPASQWALPRSSMAGAERP
jgi:hypothetical protein